MKKTAIVVSVYVLTAIFCISVYAGEADVREEIEAIQKKIKEQGLGWEAGYNEIMDLPLEERRQRLGHVIPDDIKAMYDNLDIEPPTLSNTQSVFDWRLMGGVTPVTDQGNCGSCWAFAATAGFESAYKIATGIELDMSEQAIVSCDQQSNGCDGGWTGSAYNMFMSYGAVDESCMPYQADDTVPCTQDDCDVLAELEGYQPVPNNVDVIKSFLAIGPVSTSFTVYDDFYAYQRGCYYHADTEPTNHAVLIVGWDDNECNGNGAWIVKNSWGPGFGRLGGYFYIQYDAAAIGTSTNVPFYNFSGIGEAIYSPDSYEIFLNQGEQITETLQLSNVGDGDLRYYINMYPVTDQDEFGYFYRDSDHPEGPTYNWVDITDVGTVVDFWGYNDDGNSGPLDLGFDFEFYGEIEDELCICTNGWAALNNSFILEWENDPIPSFNVPNNLLAAFFDNLNLDNGGDIYYYTNNADSAIITYQDIVDADNQGTYTFQIILVAPDKVVYQYQSMGPARLDECTIGIENGNGSVGTQVAYNEEYLHDEMAIEFVVGDPPPEMTWIIPEPQYDIIDPFDSRDISITFDATGIPGGFHQAMISIMNTSMEQPLIEIPVTMYVDEVLSVDDDLTTVPNAFGIQSASPNPFNATTSIAYNLPHESDITLEIFNLLGQKVETLYEGHKVAGNHKITWDAGDYATGIYLVRLSNGGDSETRRITLLK